MKINSGFTTLSSANFLARAELIVAELTGNAHFPEPWPATVPSLAQLRSDLAAFRDAVLATAADNRSRLVERNSRRQQLAVDLTALAGYLQSVARGDATMLATTGFPARKVSPRPLRPAELSAPTRLRLQHGNVSGQLIVRASPVAKAASYDLQIATADPTVESNWSTVGTYTTVRRILLDGLTPGKVYTVRMRAFGAAGWSAWSAPSSLMVV